MNPRILLAASCALVCAFACSDKKPETAAAPAPSAVAPQAQKSAPAPAPPRVSPADSLPKVAPQQVRVELGYEVDEAGSIPAALASREFAAASPFVLAVRAPEGATDTEVTVRWLDDRGTALATQSARFVGGREFLDFSGPDTRSWRSGPYKAEVRVGTGPPTVLAFTIVRAGESTS